LIDERDVEAGARHIRAYGRAVRARAENRDLWTSHLRAPFLFYRVDAVPMQPR
jgi:hypothetical protein